MCQIPSYCPMAGYKLPNKAAHSGNIYSPRKEKAWSLVILGFEYALCSSFLGYFMISNVET